MLDLKFWIWQKTPFELFVQNIVPEDERDNLPHDRKNEEYSKRLMLLKEGIIDHAASNNQDVTVELENSSKTIEDFVSVETAEKLRSFSRAANRGTGNHHPSDHERWLKFVFAVHEECAGDRLDSSLLAKWLELDGWSEEQAEKLSAEYSTSLQVLKFYDRYRENLPFHE